MGTRAGIYVRISRDTAGEGLGVGRQERDCRALVEQRGWGVSRVYVDNDVSAFRSDKPRPEYERLLADVDAGEVDAIVAWHPDRLHRAPIELERFIEIIERRGIAVATVTAGDVDLATPDGRLTARITGSVARKESEDKQRRLRRKHLELAQAGKVSGGGPRPFGYETDRVTVREAEADLVREAMTRVLAGEPLAAIARDWTARGVETVTGAAWSSTAIKAFLVSPRIAGLRAHRGEVTAEAVWPAIVDRASWERVRAILTDPSRRRRGPLTRYLLTGLARCGSCGTPLVGAPRGQRKGDGARGKYRTASGASVRAYGCLKRNGGCGRVFILAEAVEDFTRDLVLARFDGRALARARRHLESPDEDDAKVVRQIAEDEHKLEALGEDFAEGRLPRTAFLAASQKVQARIDAARASLVAGQHSRALDGLVDLRTEWAGLDDTRQRAVLEAVLAAVHVDPAMGPRNRFDPNRVRPEWLV